MRKNLIVLFLWQILFFNVFSAESRGIFFAKNDSGQFVLVDSLEAAQNIRASGLRPSSFDWPTGYAEAYLKCYEDAATFVEILYGDDFKIKGFLYWLTASEFSRVLSYSRGFLVRRV